MTKRICVAGATGWAGSALSRSISQASDMELVAGISRSYAGRNLGEALNELEIKTPVFESVTDALSTEPDILVEFTKPDIAKYHVTAALEAGAHVVIGTSGLSNEDYQDIDKAARMKQRGVLAVGNFALTVVLLQKFAETAARYIPHWEIIDYAYSEKIDAPSGTARELAHRLSKGGEAQLDIPIDNIQGPKESRGIRLDGSQVHSIRLPGYTISLDIIFGMHDQKLILRHESGSSAQPYVDGAMLAIRKVDQLVGVHRGLESVMDF